MWTLASFLIACLLGTHYVDAAAGPANLSANAAAAGTARFAEVRAVREKLSQVLQHGGLRGSLAEEAKHVEAEATAALNNSATNATVVHMVVSDFQKFLADLQDRATLLRDPSQDPMDSEAKKLLPMMEEKVKRVLSHLIAEKAPSHAEEQAVVIRTLKEAVAFKSEHATQQVMQLHAAMQKAHEFFRAESATLTKEEDQLANEIQDQQATVLYKMLKQRSRLPMASQFALLRRNQFATDSFAQKLLKEHNTSVPLYMQLENLLSKSLVQKLQNNGPKSKDHMAAAGSEGRVHIVSSRMKESVQRMVLVLTAARDKLESILRHPSGKESPEEVQRAREMVTSLNRVLKDVGGTNDVSKQLSSLDEVEAKLTMWMQNVTIKHK